jgi:uncharacterized lipoprotein
MPQESTRLKTRILVPLMLLALASSLAACGLNKPDLRYRDSRLQDPLQVPADMAGPSYSASMEIPSVGASVAAPDGLDIEQPPGLRADPPDAGQE